MVAARRCERTQLREQTAVEKEEVERIMRKCIAHGSAKMNCHLFLHTQCRLGTLPSRTWTVDVLRDWVVGVVGDFLADITDGVQEIR